MTCEEQVASGGRVPGEGGGQQVRSRRVVAEGIVGLIPGQPQFLSTSTEEFAELAAKGGSGRGDAAFPAAHIAGGGPQLVGYLQLRPAAHPLCAEPLSGGTFTVVFITAPLSPHLLWTESRFVTQSLFLGNQKDKNIQKGVIYSKP